MVDSNSSFIESWWITTHELYNKIQKCSVLLCFIDPRVRKVRNKASSCPGIFSRTLRFYYVSSPVVEQIC